MKKLDLYYCLEHKYAGEGDCSCGEGKVIGYAMEYDDQEVWKLKKEQENN